MKISINKCKKRKSKDDKRRQFIIDRGNFFLALWDNPFIFVRRNLYKGILYFSTKMNGRMLDFGCGAKPYKELFTNVDEYIGVDIESSGHDHVDEEIDYYYDGEHLPFDDCFFDSIFSSEVYEHVINIDDILDELYRVLKKGGLMLATVPFVWNEHEIPYDFNRYTSYGIENLLKKHGFKVIKIIKASSYIEMVSQLKMEYIRYEFDNRKSKRRISSYLKRVLLMAEAIKGIVANTILPYNDSLYGDNIVLSRKA